MGCPRFAHGLLTYMGGPWVAHGILMGCPWVAHCWSTVKAHGFPHDSGDNPWIVHEMLMRCP